MKKNYMQIFTLLFGLIPLSCLRSGAGDSLDLSNPGVSRTLSADGITFNMQYVPYNLTCHTGVQDEGITMTEGAYWIGETEVTYDLWSTVYIWATTDSGSGFREDGGQLYSFADAGVCGTGTSACMSSHPVTTISWRDAVVFCNALTEWYNRYNSKSYACVYCVDSAYSAPIRTAPDKSVATVSSLAPGAIDNPYVNPDAKGFRLLTNAEWEAAARYIDGDVWLYGDHVSGDLTGNCAGFAIGLHSEGSSVIYGDYAVYADNSNNITSAVKAKKSNSLGIYDMSGNVNEWCFDWFKNKEYSRVMRGGSFCSSNDILPVGYLDKDTENTYPPYKISPDIGMRIAKSSDD